MQGAVRQLTELARVQPSEVGGFCVGQIVHITKEGRALVDYAGNPVGPMEARSVIDGASDHDNHTQENIPVLLVFENGDPMLPIIVGIVRETFYHPISLEKTALSVKPPREAILDGRKVALDAKEEIVLRCGKSSVTLRKDGKIVVKGGFFPKDWKLDLDFKFCKYLIKIIPID